jgi:spermidine synthase
MAKQRHTRTIREHVSPHWGVFYEARRVLQRGRSRHQRIEVLETPEFGRTLRLDGITQVVEKSDYQYHEPMVHPAMCCHRRPAEVLVIGGGDGGVLREVLKYKSLRHVDCAELDGQVVEFSRRYLSAMNKRSFDDRRVTVNVGDGRKFVEEKRSTYDVVIMDMTDPFGPSKYLYTREFFRAVKRSLKGPDGIFAMHTDSPVVRPATFGSIVKTLSRVFAHVHPLYVYVQMYASLWSISLCSDSASVSTTRAARANARLRRNRIRGLKVFSGATFDAMRVAYPYIEDILRKSSHILTDKRPDAPEPVVA